MNFSHATIYIPILFLEKKTNQKEKKNNEMAIKIELYYFQYIYYDILHIGCS